MEIR